MDVQLKELIDRIKTEGINEADDKAKQITNDADNQASEIVAKAKKEAEQILSSAKNEASQFEKASKEAVKQAGRDLILKIRTSLTNLLDSVIKDETYSAYSEEILISAIPSIITGWDKGSEKGLDVILSDKDCKKLEKNLISKLSAEMKKGVEIKPHPGIKAGFRIAEKGGDAYYDFTDEGIAENLAQHMNPVLADIIQKSVSVD